MAARKTTTPSPARIPEPAAAPPTITAVGTTKMAVKMRPSSTVAQITLPNMLKPENASTYAISRPSRTRLNTPERMPTYSGTERNSVTTTMATEPLMSSAQLIDSAPVTSPCASTCRPLTLCLLYTSDAADDLLCV